MPAYPALTDRELELLMLLSEGRSVKSIAQRLNLSVHTVRKRCKEVRGLAQLVRPVIGRDFARFNGLAP